MPAEVSTALWSLMGFATVGDDERAFTDDDVEALVLARELIELRILSAERQAALVRTWGRSYARLAEWQTSLLASVAAENGDDLDETLPALVAEVLPRVERLQTYVWRRHLASAGSRLLVADETGAVTLREAVCFVDIVGYTSRSKSLTESELVAWLESFEHGATALVTEAGGRIIKNIGDEVLFSVDDPAAALDVVLEMLRRGADEEDPFPEVRAGVAYGDVVVRLGDVFGPTVNIAARLTSAARPGSVLVDQGLHDAVRGEAGGDDPTPFEWRRVRRLSVKGYSRLAAWAVRPRLT